MVSGATRSGLLRVGTDSWCACSTGIFRDGGYAEYVTLRSEAVASIPADMDPAEAAPLMCAGLTTFSMSRLTGRRVMLIHAMQTPCAT